MIDQKVTFKRYFVYFTLCSTLAGCYFIEGGGGAPIIRPLIERDLLNTNDCAAAPCWKGWIPSETNITELESSRRFSEPTTWFKQDYLSLDGIGDDADINAIVERETGILTSLVFTGPYQLVMQNVIESLGDPAYVESSYHVYMSVDTPPLGNMIFYYPHQGYTFHFIANAARTQVGDTVQICPMGDEHIEQMQIYKRGEIEDILSFSYANVNETNIGETLSRLGAWAGYQCFDMPP